MRKEFLYKSVLGTLQRSDFQAAVHKYKVFQDGEDERRHFVIIDLQYPKSLFRSQISDLIDPQKLTEISEAIRLDAEKMHGAIISGVYWKAMDHGNFGNLSSRSTEQDIDSTHVQNANADGCIVRQREHSAMFGARETFRPTIPVSL